MCPTSVASEVLSQVDGWRVDAAGTAHQCSKTEQLVDVFLFKAVHASHKQLGFISYLTACPGFSQMITSFPCGEKV